MVNIFIKTYGCAHNQADSEFMAGLLSEAGHNLVDNKSNADIVIINTCSVKDPSEKKVFSELERHKKPVIVAGCVPQADKKNPLLQNYSLLGVKQIHRVVELVELTLAGNKVQFLERKSDLSLNLPRIRRNPLIEIIPVSSGCMGSCTFCKTKQARGGVVSFSEEDIVKQIRIGLNEGIKEVWLTSEDSGAYGLDIGTNLPNLMKKILLIERKDFKIRLGMINPEHVLNYIDDLIEIFKDDRLFKFIHVPVQSGNNKVLKEMNRPYSVEEFKEIISRLRTGVSNITISTDIICGFPDESDAEFEDTVNLVKDLKIPVVNISKFYPRPGTKAAEMHPLDTKIKKARSKKMSEINNDNISNEEWFGWEGQIIIDEYGTNNTFIGRNDFYKMIIVEGENLFGKILTVRVTSVQRDYLKGEIIN
jgi:threonylcarbamoyladenosine tRNA methylthiotransferase CDKAL1